MAEQAAPALSSSDPFGIVGTVQARFFKVERAVAEGGFGVVYRAHHEVFRAPVALKCLKVPDTLPEDKREAFLEKFRSEAELLFRLSAALPEVVRPLQFGVLDTKAFVPFLALEWLEGETLDAHLRRRSGSGKKPLGLAEAVDVLTPIARALARAHHFPDADGQGTVAIIHRDMKPENVFLATVDGERQPKILDFGIARVKAETTAIAGRQTQGDAVNAFSPAYAAPEQWYPQSYGGTGPWTDVYGLALTLLEAMLGKPPIEGDLTAMMGAALNPGWRPTPRNKGLTVSDAVEKAFVKALSVDPKQRTASVESFWTQIEAALGRRPSITVRRASMNLEDAEKKVPSLAPPPLELPKPSDPPPRPAAQAPPAPRLPEMPSPSSGPFDDVDLGGSRLAVDMDRKPAVRSRPRKNEPPPGLYIPSRPSKSLGERFSGPAWIVFVAIAIGAADFVMASGGDRVMIGPVRLVWVSGALGTLGILLAIARAFDD